MALFKTAAGSLALKITGSVLGMANALLLARFLGPAEFGVYSIVIAAATLFATLAALGLPPLVTREVATFGARNQWALLKKLLLTSHYWIVIASLLLMLLGAVLGRIDMRGTALTSYGLFVALLIIPLMALNQLRAAILRGLHWVVTADIPDLLLRPVSMFAALGVVYVFSLSITSSEALMMQTGAIMLATIVGAGLLFPRLPNQMWHVDAETSRPAWLRSSSIFLAITAVGMLELQVPLYLLGFILGAKQAGIYQVSTQVVSVIIIGLSAVNLPLQSKVAALWARGEKEEAQHIVTAGARLGGIIAVLMAAILLPLAGLVLGVIGNQYGAAADTLRVLVIGQLVNALMGPCGVVLAMTGNHWYAFLGRFCALLLTAILSWLLIPVAGTMGAAIAMLSGLVVWNLILVWQANRKLGIYTPVIGLKLYPKIKNENP